MDLYNIAKVRGFIIRIAKKHTVVINRNQFQAIKDLDHKIIIEKQREINSSKAEVIETMIEWMTLQRVYVYDKEKEMCRLCGKLDCNFAVHAIEGQVIHLAEL